MAQAAQAQARSHHRKAGQPGPGDKGKKKKEKPPELLVFGYACKLFREDEKALAQERGSHLIPWMGDDMLQIDRYDCRGHLHDLSECDAGSWNRDYQLSEEEARIEALCDEERYLALHTDLLEEEARQEEEYRRLSAALAEDGTYHAVDFAYRSDYYDPSQPTEEEEMNKAEAELDSMEENEEPYTAPAGLLVPSDVEVPATSKMHAIIERTAKFVCIEGTQFEIMLKAKQARNSQFDFLRFDHYLNPYYRHILKTMKEGKYVPHPGKNSDDKRNSLSEDGEEDDDDGDGGYLHPSLFATKRNSRLEELTRPLKIMDPDHPLAALVRKVQADAKISKQLASEEAAASAATEYSTDAMGAMYYGYYMMPDGTYCMTPPPPGMEVAGYYGTVPSEAATSTATGVSAPPPPGTTPPPSLPVTDSGNNQLPAATVTSSASTSLPVIIPPPPDTQPVIDKLAQYVARNGTKFETSVRAKNDPRFEFLQPWHQFNAYYEFKKQYFAQKEGGGVVQETLPASALAAGTSAESLHASADDALTSTEAPGVAGPKPDLSNFLDRAANDGKLLKASFAPISFAIKAKENDMLPLEKKRVKLDDDSDDETLDPSDDSHKDAACFDRAPEERRPQLTAEEIEAKHAKQRLEAKLAAAAREKLAQASKECKERQLQAERKKKAALFLQNLKHPTAFGEAEAGTAEDSAQHIEFQAASEICSQVLSAAARKTPERSSPAPPPTGPSRQDKKKEKKHRKKSRSRSRSRPRYRLRSRSRSRSHSHSKAKHSLPSAYRSVRHSRSPHGRRAQCSERRREDREHDVPSAYRVGNSSGLSTRKRSRSRSPYEKKKKKSSRSHPKLKGRTLRSRSRSLSPKKCSSVKSSAHSTSLSPAESRVSSPSHSRGVSQEKDGTASPGLLSSMQSKITQDLMAKVRAMLAASKDIQTNVS